VFAGDLGLLTYLTCADGNAIENPRWLRRGLVKLAKLQRKHARCKKGSKNKEKLRLQIAKQNAFIKNARKDFLHKLSYALVKFYDIFIFEDLLVKGMVKNKGLSKSISDASWGMFLEFVSYKAEWRGKIFLKINRYYPSSKLCSNCDEKNKALTLTDREWQCTNCGEINDRDENAAFNILKEGVRQLIGNAA
jgi:putative transposase